MTAFESKTSHLRHSANNKSYRSLLLDLWTSHNNDVNTREAKALNHRKTSDVQGSVLLWAASILSKGGVWSRHWRALLRKQVFPILCKPAPTGLIPRGQLVSIVPVYKDLEEAGVACSLALAF